MGKTPEQRAAAKARKAVREGAANTPQNEQVNSNTQDDDETAPNGSNLNPNDQTNDEVDKTIPPVVPVAPDLPRPASGVQLGATPAAKPIIEAQNVSPATTGTQAAPKQMIEVDASKLDALLDQVKKQQNQIEILTESVSQGKLTDAENKRKPKANPRVFLKTWLKDGKDRLITSWKSNPENRLVYSAANPNVIVGEIIEAEYFFSDGETTGMIEQVRMTRNEGRAYGEVVGKKADSAGRQDAIYLIKMEDSMKWGQEILEVHYSFINP